MTLLYIHKKYNALDYFYDFQIFYVLQANDRIVSLSPDVKP